MKLREKILLLSGLALTTCAYALYFASSQMFLRNFRNLEEHDADHATRQALEALNERIDALQTVNMDWSRWDDSYSFMEDLSDHYKTSNLNNESLAGLRLNMIAYVRVDGSIAYATGFDYIAKRFRPVPAGVNDQILQEGGLLARCMGGEPVKGLALVPEGPMIIAAHPVTDSEGKQSPRGMLVMARFLEIREMTDLRRVSRQMLNLYPATDPIISSELAVARIYDPVDPPVRVGTPGDNVITGYGIITDIFNRPGLILRTVMPRDILGEGRKTVNMFLIALIVTGLIATVIVAWLFERLVLSPLSRLRADVAWTAARGVLSGRLPVTGTDDIAATAREINRLLDTVEQIHLRAREHGTRHGTDDQAGRLL